MMRKNEMEKENALKYLKASDIASCSDILVYNYEYNNQYAIV